MAIAKRDLWAAIQELETHFKAYVALAKKATAGSTTPALAGSTNNRKETENATIE